MAIDPKININENQVIFRGNTGHRHDGLTSTLIDTTKYSMTDFVVYPTAPPGTARRNFQQNNLDTLSSFIVEAIERRVLNPQGIRLRANTITANEIAANTITADELAANIVLVKNIIRSNNYATGSTGWSISGSGDAEFSNVTVRGTVVADAGSIGGIIISDSAIYSSNYDTNNGFAIYSTGLADFNNINVRGHIEALTGYIGDDFEIGSNVLINNNATILNNLTIGNNIRINGATGDGSVSVVKIRADSADVQANSLPLHVVSFTNQTLFRVRRDARIDMGSTTDPNASVYVNGTLVHGSDERFKEDIGPTKLGLDFINMLNPVEYKFKSNSNSLYHQGFIAQDVKRVFKDINIESAIWQKSDNSYEYLNYQELIAPIVKGIQELSNKIDNIEARLQAIEGV